VNKLLSLYQPIVQKLVLMENVQNVKMDINLIGLLKYANKLLLLYQLIVRKLVLMENVQNVLMDTN